MLVLTRKQGESIQIGSDITVHITQISGNQVKIGIDAPSFVVVMRSEIVDNELPLVSVKFVNDELYP